MKENVIRNICARSGVVDHEIDDIALTRFKSVDGRTAQPVAGLLYLPKAALPCQAV